MSTWFKADSHAAGCQKLIPHTPPAHPHVDIWIRSAGRGHRSEQVLDPESCKCWVKPSQGESTVCVCVCVCVWSRFLIGCQHSPASPPSLASAATRSVTFILAKPRQQNVLLGSADCLSAHTYITPRNPLNTNCCRNADPAQCKTGRF